MLILFSNFSFATNNPSDARQVRAEAFVNLSLADVQALVPTQIPLMARYRESVDTDTLTIDDSYAKCPSHSSQVMQWIVSDPHRMTCVADGQTYPSATYPENTQLTLDTWQSKTQKIPYFKAPDGTAYYLKGTIDSFKQFYLHGMLEDLAYAYEETGQSSRFAKRMLDIYAAYADVIDDWVVVGKTGFEVYDTSLGSQSLFPDIHWGHRHSYTMPFAWFKFYEQIYADSVLDETSPYGATFRDHINENFFRMLMLYTLSYPEEFGVYNNIGTNIRDMLNYGTLFQWPEAMHYALRWSKSTADLYPVAYDGMSLEGSNYHYLWASSYMAANGAWSWVDPAGYLDAVDGTNISEPLTPNDIFNSGKRQEGFATAPIYINLPDGSRTAVHDNTRFLDLDQGGWYRIEKAPEESRSRILPGFGHATLGDGRDEQKTQSQLHFSGYGNHASKETLIFQFYAHGRAQLEYAGHQNYTRTLVNKNGVSVDHLTANVYYSDIKGQPEFFAPTLPGLSAIRVENDDIRFDKYQSLERYNRTLLQNTVDLDSPYVLDIFEVKGGGWHEYQLGGSMFMAQSATANIAMSNVSGATPYYQDGDEGVWDRFHDVSEGEITQGSYVDFVFDDQPNQGTRIHLSAMAGDSLSLSRLDSVKRSDELIMTNRPHLRISRGGRDTGVTDLASSFVVVHEAFKGSSVIQSVNRYTISESAMAILVVVLPQCFCSACSVYLV